MKKILIGLLMVGSLASLADTPLTQNELDGIKKTGLEYVMEFYDNCEKNIFPVEVKFWISPEKDDQGFTTFNIEYRCEGETEFTEGESCITYFESKYNEWMIDYCDL